MSKDNTLWMGDIKPWMNESLIMNSFLYYNVKPSGVKLIKDKKTNINRNYCFINFKSVEDANYALTNLNGKQLPNLKFTFKLNWADYHSAFTKSVYVGNLNLKVDDIELYNLFKQKYESVHHASVITDKGISKGYGFVIFRGEEDYKRSLNEMNGITFHGTKIKVKEQKRKEEDNINIIYSNTYNKFVNNQSLPSTNNSYIQKNDIKNVIEFKTPKRINNNIIFNNINLNNNENIDQKFPTNSLDNININYNQNININTNNSQNNYIINNFSFNENINIPSYNKESTEKINIKGPNHSSSIGQYSPSPSETSCCSLNSGSNSNKLIESPIKTKSKARLEDLEKIDDPTLLKYINASIHKTFDYYRNLYSIGGSRPKSK